MVLDGEVGVFLVVFFGGFQAGVEGGEGFSAAEGSNFFFHSPVFVGVDA